MLLTASMQNGGFIYADRFAESAMQKAFEGKSVVIHIEEFKGWRSHLQIKYWRGYVLKTVRQGYRDTLGIDVISDDHMHEILIQAFIPPENIFDARSGEVIGKKQRRTSDLSKKEMMELIERVQRFGAEELHIVINDPDPNWKENKKELA